MYVNFSPAVSRDALRAMRQRVRSWHLQLKSDKELSDLSKMFNPVLRGWANYYGRFYASGLSPLWRHVNEHLTRWMQRKYKRLQGHKIRAGETLGKLAASSRKALVHWERGIFPGGSMMGAG